MGSFSVWHWLIVLLIVSLLVAVLCFTPLFALLIGLALLIGAYFWTLKTARHGGVV